MNGAPSETRPGPPGPRSWAEVSRLARTVYDEFAFQSIYALKQGNLLADPDGTGKGDGVAKARRRVTQSKMMISFLLLLVISSSLFTLARGEAYLGVSLDRVAMGRSNSISIWKARRNSRRRGLYSPGSSRRMEATNSRNSRGVRAS